MLMTEEEAKTKWCPQVRYGAFQEPAANRWKQSAPEDQPHALNPVPCRCIGSDCMAWRWGPRADQPIKVCKAGDTAPLAEEGGIWIRKREGSNEWGLFIRTGRCGLAGPVLP